MKSKILKKLLQVAPSPQLNRPQMDGNASTETFSPGTLTNALQTLSLQSPSDDVETMQMINSSDPAHVEMSSVVLVHSTRSIACCGCNESLHNDNVAAMLKIFNDIWIAIISLRSTAEKELSLALHSDLRTVMFNNFTNYCERVWRLYRAYSISLSSPSDNADVEQSGLRELTYQLQCFKATFCQENIVIVPSSVRCLFIDSNSRSLLQRGLEQLEQEMTEICKLGALLSIQERETVELRCQQCLYY